MHIQIQSLFASLTQATQLLHLFQSYVEICQAFSQIPHRFPKPSLYISNLSKAVCQDDIVDIVRFLVYLGLVFVFL